MAKKSFTGTGIKAESVESKPEYKRSILDDIIPSSSTAQMDTSSDLLKRQTFLLREAVIERIKDYVYTQKIKGDLMYTQQNVVEEALDQFFLEKEILQRPDSYIEKRGRK